MAVARDVIALAHLDVHRGEILETSSGSGCEGSEEAHQQQLHQVGGTPGAVAAPQ